MSATSLFRTEVATAMAVALVLGLVLLALRPKDRASTRNALVLLGFCALAGAADTAIGSMGGLGVAGILADASTVLVGVVLIRMVGILVFRVLLPAVRIVTARIVEDLTTTGLMLAWGLVWLRLAGVDLGSLITTSAVITGVVAFSMQETLGNILGGVVLQLDQSIRVGDWVKVDETSGRVVEIRWRYTAVETRNRETVVIPNGWLVKNRFTLIGSRADPAPIWRRWVYLDVGIDCPPLKVCEVLERAVGDADIPHVAREPAATAVLMTIGDGYGHYALRYFLDDPVPDDPTDSLVRAHAVAALTRNGMAIAVPREERLLIKDNEAHRAVQHAKEIVRREAALARVDLFAPLSEAERRELAEHLVYAPFVKGDTVTRQGSVAHWLYLIVAGEAEVWLEANGERTHVATLIRGSVFGEMGLMTGAPRRATITARSDLECYRLDKAGLERILRSRPDIAGEISRILASRQTELTDRRDSAASGGPRPTRDADILAKIRNFFGLAA
ncbi:MAG: mechanosensitive ion channel [Betaproteobacteria bacterium]|nr:mechanosensitive ion channel [Betaproteobacteria bacterium]